MKRILKPTVPVTLFLVSVTGLLVPLVLAIADGQGVLLESMESKTTGGGPVFNKIKWFRFQDKDVWMMNQSHHGSLAEEESWDRLAIVIDKTKFPKTARFYQFEPGPLEWREGLRERPFEVSCFMCHNNGPRVIRPNYQSPFEPISLKDRLKLSYWNLQIKLYGRVLASPVHDDLDQSQLPPFRFRSTYENEPLQITTCIKCHKESGFLARGLLRRQQLPTIKFMVESGLMPPLGFALTAKEKQELDRFLEGF